MHLKKTDGLSNEWMISAPNTSRIWILRKFVSPRKTNTTIYQKKKHESKMHLLLKMDGLLQHCLISVFGVLVRLLETLVFLVSTWQPLNDTTASALIGGRVASTLSVLDSWRTSGMGFFHKGVGLKRILKKPSASVWGFQAGDLCDFCVFCQISWDHVKIPSVFEIKLLLEN